MMRRRLRPLAAAAAALVAPGVARAQSVDHAALQATLGEPVTTSVTGKPQRASAAPASIVIITRDEILRSPARSVPDLLKAYAGIDVNRWTAGQSDVAVRGGVQPYNARLLVLVNGRQVYLDHYGMTDWNLLGVPLDAIQQIELVRGPGSALFGFNAASGVVNIVTLAATGAPRAVVTAEGGTHGYSRLSGVVSAPVSDAVAVQLTGARQREDERDVPASIGQPPRVADVIADSVSGTIVVTPDPATQAELKGGYADNRQLEFLPTAILTTQRLRTRTAGASVSHDTGWGVVHAQAYANWLDAEYQVTGTQAQFSAMPLIAPEQNRIVVAKASSLVRIDTADTVRVGVEYRSNRIESGSLYASRIGYQGVAIDTMADLHPNERLSFTAAGRVDRLTLGIGGPPRAPVIDPASAFDRSITRLSFNAAMLLAVGDGGQLRVNGGRGLQSPSLTDFGFRTRVPLVLQPQQPPIIVYSTGNPAIRPATVWSGEVGYAQRLGSATRIEATLFLTRTGDVIASPGDLPAFTVITVPEPAVVTRFGNVGSFRTYGASVVASGRVRGGLGWLANYTLTAVSDRLPGGGPPYPIAFAPKATTPRHVANAGVDYALGRWSGAATARFTSATRQFAFDPTGALALFPVRRAVGIDARIGYRVGRQLDIYAAGENLSGAGGVAGSPIPADRRLRLGVRHAL